MFYDHYLPGEPEAKETLASPFLADDYSGLPPAIIITAGYDPLRDESKAYGEKLREAEVQAKVRRYDDGMIHGFASIIGALEDSRKAMDEMGQELRSALKP